MVRFVGVSLLLAVAVPQIMAFTQSPVVKHGGATKPSTYSPGFQKDTLATTTTTRLGLSPSSLVSSIASPLASLSVLAGVVLVHEAGHYLAARSLGITVEEFSVGVGPKLTGFTAGKEEFNLRALPVGGYVRFPENYNATLVQQQEREAFQANQLAKEKMKKQAQGKTGLFKFLPFGKKKQQEQQQTKQTPWWSRAFRKNNKQQVRPERKTVEIEYYDDPDLLQNRPWAQRAVVLSGGIVFNFLLAFLCFFGEITVGKGLPHPVMDNGAVIASMRPGSASAGVLQPGDVIMGINGVPVSNSPNMAASQRAISDLIADIRATPLGDSVRLEVKRPGESLLLKDVVVKPQPMATTSPDQVGPQSLGVMLAPNYLRTDMIRTSSPIEGAKYAAGAVTEMTKETAASLFGFLGQMVTPNSAAPAGQMSGPIGLIRTGSEVVSRNDVGAIVTFAAAVSVNLAVINALPLPALDGGQLVFVMAEAVTRRKVDQQLQEGITAATLLFLLVVSVGTAVGDVESIFSR